MSTLKVDTIQDTNAVEMYLCKAWVNFNGTGTVAIRESGNVSSITDNGTGDYTVNFTNALEDANYAVCGTSSNGISLSNYSNLTAPTTTAVRVISYLSGFVDVPYNSVAIFR